MVVSSGSLRLLIFLLAILIPACASSSQAFCMMSSAYKLNKQGDNIQPWHIPFPIENQSVVPCLVLTVASWPAYRFLRSQVRWSGIPISLRWTLGCLKTHKAKNNNNNNKKHTHTQSSAGSTAKSGKPPFGPRTCFYCSRSEMEKCGEEEFLK